MTHLVLAHCSNGHDHGFLPFGVVILLVVALCIYSAFLIPEGEE